MFILYKNNMTNNSNFTYSNSNTTENDLNDLGILSIICVSIIVCFCMCTSNHERINCIDKCVKELFCMKTNNN